MSAAASGPPGGPARDPGTQTVKAVAVTLVAVLIAVLILHHSGGSVKKSASKPSSHSTTTTTGVTGPAVTTTTQPLVTASSVRLQVLNGANPAGNISSAWSAKLHAAPYNYDTLSPNDATTTVSASQIYIITAGYLPEAQALAKAVGLAATAIVTTVPPPSTAPIPATDRSTADLVLVIGPDLANKA